MCSLLQCGQRPGRVKRFRFLKTKPQFMHREGMIISFFFWAATDRSIWERCVYTSFSRIPIAWESPRALISCLHNREIICFRIVPTIKSIYDKNGIVLQLKQNVILGKAITHFMEFGSVLLTSSRRFCISACHHGCN